MTESLRVSRDTPAGPVRLQVTASGDGSPVVLIPSLGRGASDLLDLSGRLAQAGWRSLAIDSRGIAGSTGPLTGITLHDLAADVAEVVRQLCPGSTAHVVGHAFGNRIARCLAADDGGLVDKVVLLAAGGQVPPEPGAVESFRAFLAGGLNEDQARRAIADANFSPASNPDAWTTGWWLETATAQIAAAKATAVTDWWQAFSAPALVVQGLDDRMAPPQNGRSLAAAAPPGRVTLVEIADAGHALLPEQPDEVAGHVVRFLRGSSARL